MSTVQVSDEEYIQVDRTTVLRCPNPRCRKVLAIGQPPKGEGIEIKCKHCKTYARFQRV